MDRVNEYKVAEATYQKKVGAYQQKMGAIESKFKGMMESKITNVIKQAEAEKAKYDTAVKKVKDVGD